MGIYMCMKSCCRVSGEDFAHSIITIKVSVFIVTILSLLFIPQLTREVKEIFIKKSEEAAPTVKKCAKTLKKSHKCTFVNDVRPRD